MNIIIVHSVDNAKVLLAVRVVLIVFGIIGGGIGCALCLLFGPICCIVLLPRCCSWVQDLVLDLLISLTSVIFPPLNSEEEIQGDITEVKEKNSEEVKGMFVEMTLPISEKGASILPVLIPLGLAKYAGQLIDEGFESASDLCLATEADLISIGMLHAEAQSLLCNLSHVLPATGAEGGTGVAVVAAGKAQSRAARLRQKSRAARIRQMREAKAATAAANAAGSGGGLARRDSLIIHGKVTSEV
jgi:hypothetical protein